MNNKWFLAAAGLVIVFIVAAGGFFYLNKKSTPIPTQTPTQTQTQVSSPTPEPTASVSESAKKTVTVTLTSSGFSPATITIDSGTTVVWKNESGQTATVNSNPHPIHTDFAPLNLGQFENGQTLSLKFTAPGTHGYHNHLNSSEKGTIIVK